ncbi:hydrogenase/sulfur reductase, alpha subunit [Labilithrix luteola]|uniref:Hydrogenase/sulfur reductase, alpha subunit n=1 Tax=Labilithrix luteola TaxID=1391654 RepID=A0A0K1PRU6_9BACT|nr:Ni/Fe hydrogenase subunit alpha [Labilithrix luteola]AKU96260.1 hydrogenase/sulfur reductase, alpha subunit [Labilithrix luteola]
MKTSRTIDIGALARVEGHGAVTLVLDGEVVVDAKLRIFEPPRLFEAFLRGRDAAETPDITSRICGICPVAYQMSAAHAVEDAFGVTVDGQLRALRRLLYCGEWIESHVLHMVMLHAPDFLGVHDVIAMSKHHPERVKAALRVKKAGNSIIETLGGRAIHPVNAKIGGFWRAPSSSELGALRPALIAALEDAEETLDWIATFEFPPFERDYEFVALRHPAEYPMNEGRIVSTKGLDVDVHDFETCIREEQVPYATALRSKLSARGAYICGPLARFALNAERLSPRAVAAAARVALSPSCRNPYRSILVRGVEVVHALDEAVRLVDEYERPSSSSLPWSPRAGRGCGATEAPRGLLYQRYDIEESGLVRDARIVPPTSQNQLGIEEDLVALGSTLAGLSAEKASRRVAHAIRNYDPCISCSTHALTIRFEPRQGSVAKT